MSIDIFKRSGVDIAYRSRGAGDCVILIHALATSQELWKLQIIELEKEHRVLAFDLRGHGRSSAPVDGDFSFETLARDVVELMDHLKIAQADIIGISVGGEVAQVVAALYPARVGRLVLISTACYTSHARAALWVDRVTDARRVGMAAVAAATTLRWFSAAFAEQHPDVLAWCEHLVAATPLPTYESLAQVIERMDLRPLISGISRPTLVICGELDGNTGRAAAQMLVDCIRGARLVVMPGAGHFPNLESPIEFASLCADFLGSAAA